MPDYKEMYFTLFRATEQAIQTLIAAQQQCEELYLSAPPEGLSVLPNAVLQNAATHCKVSEERINKNPECSSHSGFLAHRNTTDASIPCRK